MTCGRIGLSEAQAGSDVAGMRTRADSRVRLLLAAMCSELLRMAESGNSSSLAARATSSPSEASLACGLRGLAAAEDCQSSCANV